MRDGQKGFIPIILLVLVIVVVVGAYFLGTKNGNLNSIVSVGTPVATQVADMTANWKVYDDNGIYLKYPTNFIVQGGIYQGAYDGKELLITLQVSGTEKQRPSNELSITTSKTSGLDSFLVDIYNLKLGETWSNPNFSPKYTRIIDSKVGNFVAHVYSQAGDSEGLDRMIILNNDGKYYVFMYDSKNSVNIPKSSPEYGVDFQTVFSEVLSTFKFTK